MEVLLTSPTVPLRATLKDGSQLEVRSPEALAQLKLEDALVSLNEPLVKVLAPAPPPRGPPAEVRGVVRGVGCVTSAARLAVPSGHNPLSVRVRRRAHHALRGERRPAPLAVLPLGGARDAAVLAPSGRDRHRVP